MIKLQIEKEKSPKTKFKKRIKAIIKLRFASKKRIKVISIFSFFFAFFFFFFNGLN
jgi:hypothetical protein